MPTTSKPALTSSAAVTEESTPPDIAMTMRWSAGLPARSRSAGCIQAHPPEIGFQAGGGGKTCRQRWKAPVAGATAELLVERRRAIAREALVFRPGIHLQPLAVRIAVAPGGRLGYALGGDLGVADRARRQRHFQVEPVAGNPAVEHEAGIGDRLRCLRLGGHLGLSDTPAAAIFDMQPNLDIERRRD